MVCEEGAGVPLGIGSRFRPPDERAPADAFFADFAGSEHMVRMLNPGCLRMRSVRKSDGDIVGVDFVGTAGGPDEQCSGFDP